MDTREFLARYARSAYGLGTTLASLALGLVALALGSGAVLALAVAAAALVASLVVGLATGWGQAAAVGEGERKSREHAGERMALAAAARKRLAALRLPPGPVATARDLLVLEAGLLLESFSAKGSWDPEAAQAVEDALGLVDAWQREADEASIERRFGLPDANPFPEAAERTALALREKARLIASRRAEAAGEIPAVDRVAIEEELR